MVEMIKYSVSLALVASLATLSAVFIHGKTEHRVDDTFAATRDAALRQIVPADAQLSEKKTDVKQGAGNAAVYWLAINALQDTTYCFTLQAQRYPGKINFVLGVGTDGLIKGMSFFGSGSDGMYGCLNDMYRSGAKRSLWSRNGAENRAGQPWFTEQFVGCTVNRPISVDITTGEWFGLDTAIQNALRKNNRVSAITGATRSTRAITEEISIKARLLLKAARG
jgi:Na+-translocating ferredoxin:NAD+ oxidoreductase RnfG subunit